tara:strand:- start:384 stop:578 length:195 start_codon:yes stop_codon:yes gene_type:complete
MESNDAAISILKENYTKIIELLNKINTIEDSDKIEELLHGYIARSDKDIKLLALAVDMFVLLSE